ncbi:universal stress protein [Ramlibacter sp. Leaf400]|uniref:universal stress protein n=1 Tax=Ramlibacter sp. Leaf400 TaxID=1736365 RepID=UPI000701F136|nr:universal stress protein [Ramlibacter sp. Leaf400]KQT10875.1 universal stress protein UspA [Ramlibacter sp. Leaf400]
MTTSYTQILVHLDAGRRITEAVMCGRRLAQEQGAALAALDVTRPALVSVPVVGELGALTGAALADLDAQRRKAVRTTFDAAMSGPGPAAQFGEICELQMAGAFAQQALYADLLVLSQPHPDLGPGEAPRDFNELVLAASGKPALILPAVGPLPQAFATLAIAWKPTRETAHAVAGAMPLLQRAAQVHVVTWGPDEDEDEGGVLDLDRYLNLYGVTARWHRRGEEPGDLGELLLSQAFDLGADLLVMGCYGHGRAREWMLGGVSRTVLRSMTLPVLMAH